MTYTVGSLFSGIGGIDLAFQWAGFRVAWQVENDDFCNRVLAKHWPDVPRFGDVRSVTGTDLAPVDVMAGGFPCQPFSLAGKRQGADDARYLWPEFARLIGDLRPSIVFLENVPGILTRDGVAVVSDLAAMGYDAEWGIVAASDAGAPHRRERWFCVAYAQRAERRASAPGRYGMEVSDAGLPAGQESADRFTGRSEELADADGRRCQQCNTPIRGLPITHEKRRRDAESLFRRVLDGLSAGVDGPYRHRWPARPGQPQYDWEPSRTVASGMVANRAARLKALGNAVVPQVVYPIALEIMALLTGA